AQQAQLVVADVSDPVHPELIEREVAGQVRPYHLEVPLPPDGFVGLALQGDALLLAGGNRLYHYDLSLPSEPLLLSETTLLTDAGGVDHATGVAARDDLVFLGSASGIRIYQLLSDNRLRERGRIDGSTLGGTPGAMTIDDDALWVALPAESQAVAVDLRDGRFGVRHRVSTLALSGDPVRPASLLVRDGLLLAGTGRGGTVVAYQIREGDQSVAVGQLPLSHLVPSVPLHAGQLALQGQTLYVAAGDGDVQLFDVSPWLDLSFGAAPRLDNYYALTGSAQALGLGRRAIFAGTAFLQRGGELFENPVQRPNEPFLHFALEGALDTLSDDGLSVVDQVPAVRGVLPVDAAIELQLNRIVDDAQLTALGESLLEVTRGGAPIAGSLSQQVDNTGSRLIFRPLSPLEAGRQYRARLSGSLTDVQGQPLGADYSFRFTAETGSRPVVERVSPLFGSWRGGAEITLQGTGLTSSTVVTLGGQVVAPNEVLSATGDELRFLLPALSEAPEGDRLVGLRVANGALESFQAARFTYVADPVLELVGQYRPLTGELDDHDDRFLFNAGERIGLRGRGLNRATTVQVNGRPASDLRVIDSRTLSLQVPDDTLGPLTLTVQNPGSPAVATNTETSVQLDVDVSRYSPGGIIWRQHGPLLALAEGETITLMSVRDGLDPVPLSSVDAGTAVQDLALGERYLMVLLAGSGDLLAYDIENVFEPLPINRIRNDAGVEHDSLSLAGERFVSLGSDGVHVGSVRGGGFETLALGAVQDVAVDDRYLYVLSSDGLDARPLGNFASSALAAPLALAAASPSALRIAPQRLLVMGGGEVELVDTAEVSSGGGLISLGAGTLDGLQDAALAGELLAAIRTVEGSRELALYDLDGGAALGLDRIARVDVEGPQRVTLVGEQLRFSASGHLEGTRVPIPNFAAITPLRSIGDPVQPIALAVVGSADAFSSVSLDVRAVSNGSPVAGDTRLLGADLRFSPIGDVYAAGEGYRVSLFNAPAPRIDGAELHHDQSYRLDAVDVFGVAEMALTALSPTVAVVGAPTDFTVTGVGLDQVTELRVAGLTLAAGDFSVDAAGTTLTFNATVSTAGIHTLAADAAAGTDALPAALRVTPALSIASVGSDHPAGSATVGDSGGALVSLSGDGFDGGVQLHFLRSGAGISPGPQNRVASDVASATSLSFQAPACVAGAGYDLVAIKPETGESVTAAGALACVDDTRPRLLGVTPLSASRPLFVSYSEPVTASGWSVTMAPRDYSGAADQDVTSDFALTTTGAGLEVASTVGTLPDNRIYTVQVSGIADAVGNAPAQGATLNHVFIAGDTLPPRDLTLTDVSTGQPLDAASVLTRGRSYTLKLDAEENMPERGALSRSVRLTRDGGATYGAPLPISSSGQITVDVAQADTSLGFRLQAVDGSGNVARRDLGVALQNPAVDLVSLTSDPATLEEGTAAELRLRVEGDDLSIVTGAEFLILGQTRLPDSVVEVSATAREYRVQVQVPERDELQRLTGAPSLPVRCSVYFGVNGGDFRDDVLPVAADQTAPEVAIVAPANGAGVPRDEPTDVLIRSFDRFGIDRVDMSVDGGASFQTLADPTRFELTASGTDPITLTARAYDSAGNSAEHSIQVRPYDPLEGAPSLAVVSPADGTHRRERETVRVEVDLRNVLDAELHLDLGGVEDDPQNPAPIAISRTAGDPVRVPVDVTLPSVDQELVAVLRLQETVDGPALTARSTIIIEDDETVDEPVDTRLQPAVTVLGGSTLYVDARRPDAMADFSDTSVVEIEDPTGAVTASFGLGQGVTPVDVDPAGTSTTVRTRLRDLSGNERSDVATLSKLPYLGSAVSTLFTAPAGSTTSELIVAPGVAGGGEHLVFAVNHDAGGYELRDAAGILHAEASGTLGSLSFTGAGLAAVERNGANRALVFWPLTTAGLGSPVRTPLLGELLGGSGDTLFTRHGALFDGYRHTGGELVQLAGVTVGEPVAATHVFADRVFVLTEFGNLQTLRVASTDLPALERIFTTAAEPGTGLNVDGARLRIWQGSTLHRFELLTPDPAQGIVEGDLVELGSLDVGGTITGAVADGELLWLSSDGPFEQDGLWQAYLDGERVAFVDDGALTIAFAAGRLYALHDDGSVGVRPLAATAATTPLAPTLTDEPLTVHVAGIEASGTLGGDQVVFSDASSGASLPFEPVWRQGALEYRLARGALGGAVQLQRLDR
ncbi:MAG: IPT/TIG domain-containing protein, partial [Myxococcales bacterium]